MLRRGLRWKTSVGLTRTLSYCLLVLQPPGSVASSQQAWSVPCLQPSVVLPSSKERSGWPSSALALVGGWSWHARLPRSRPQHPLSGSQETNVLNTAHLLMWRHTQPYMYAAAIDRKRWQFKSIYGVLYGDNRHLIVTLVGRSFSGYRLLVKQKAWCAHTPKMQSEALTALKWW